MACRKCGGTDLYKDGKCRPCRKANRDAWREKNRDKIQAQTKANYEATKQRQLAVQRERRAANPELYKQRVKQWVDANPDRMSELRKRWKAENKEKVCAYSQDRRARIAEAGGKLSEDDLKCLLVLQKYKCAICRKSLKKGYHADHIIPLSAGGQNIIYNIQMLCPRCNLQKGAKDPIEFMSGKGFLL